MIHTLEVPTMVELNEGMTNKLLLAREDQLDVITSVDVQIHNTIATAESMVWDLELKDLWLTPQRWSMMVRQYLDPAEVTHWIDKTSDTIGTRGRGISMLRTKTVAARGGADKGNKETRRWGSCMLAVSYKAKPRPQITLYSRTSYLGYLGGMDMSVAWMLGRYLAEQLDIEVEDMAFTWINECPQWHFFKSIAYMLHHPDPEKQAQYRKFASDPARYMAHPQIKDRPALHGTLKWVKNFKEMDDNEQTLGDMSYNTYRRVRRRYHTEVLGYDRAKDFEGWSFHKKAGVNRRTGEAFEAGDPKEYFKAYKPLPSCKISTLDLSAIGL